MELWKIALTAVISIVSYRIFTPDIIVTLFMIGVAATAFFIFPEKREKVIYIMFFLAYWASGSMFIFDGKIEKGRVYSMTGEKRENGIILSKIDGRSSVGAVFFKSGNSEFDGRGSFEAEAESVTKDRNVTVVNGRILDSRRGIFDKFREHISKRIEEVSKSRITAGVMKALIIGDGSDVPKEINDAFKYTGTSHVLVISGLHIAMMTVIILKLLEFFNVGYKKRHIIALIFLTIYSFTAGLSPSVARAYVMGVIFLAGRIMWEESELTKSFWATFIIMLFFEPASLFSLSFQLSYGALFAIIYIYELVKKEEENPFIDILKLSFIIQLVLSPLFVYYFGKMPFLSFAANLIAVPVGNVAVQAGFFTLFAMLVFPLGDIVYSLILEYLARTMLYYIWLMEKIPLMQIEIDSAGKFMFLMLYAAFSGTTVYCWMKQNERAAEEREERKKSEQS